MNRQAGVSELRRHPMRLVDEAKGTDNGITITFRGIPVAILQGWSGPDVPQPRPDCASGEESTVPGDVGGWLQTDREPEGADAETVLDSASWGTWESLSEEQRRRLVRAIQEQRVGSDTEAAQGEPREVREVR